MTPTLTISIEKTAAAIGVPNRAAKAAGDYRRSIKNSVKEMSPGGINREITSAPDFI